MADRFEIVAGLFAAARELPQAERARFLAEGCGGDDALRSDIERLLRHDAPGPLDAFDPLSEIDSARSLPDHIGSFHVVALIGTGGMGVVYEAEQENPRRTVAVKVIRTGLAHGASIQRFQREVKALGRLEHPGIARIYEAGTADFGHGPQPYFAMERVRGATLLKHCEARKLDHRGRVNLLAAIADALQHAHECGVVHRDLKPGNVLVTADGQPKVLDFGVARIVDPDHAQSTLTTGEGQIVGTLQYMSPEQVSGREGAVDARSDVYALGLIGFEMLTGRLPYEIGNTPIAQAARVIQDQDATALGVFDPRLAGDLDTIFAKALEKEPARRYGSAREFAADLRSFLADRPIAARPASVWYQLSKFGRRNRGLMAGVLIAFVVLIAGSIAITVFALAERRHRVAAEAAADKAVAVQDLWLETLAWTDPYRANGDKITVVAALDAASERLARGLSRQPETEAAFRHAVGVAFSRLGVGAKAVAQLARAVELRRGGAGSRAELIDSLFELGRAEQLDNNFTEGVRALREAFELARIEFGPDRARAWTIETELARSLRGAGHSQEARSLVVEAREQLARVAGTAAPIIAHAEIILAEIDGQRGDPTAGEVAARRAVAALSARPDDDPHALMHARLVLANMLSTQGRHADAEPLYRAVLAAYSAVLGADHPNTLTARMNLAINLARQNRIADAEREFLAVRIVQERTLGGDAFQTLLSMSNTIGLHVEQGQPRDALALAEDLQARAARALAPDDWHRGYFEFMCGLVFVDAGRVEAGRHLLAGALPLLEEQFGKEHEIPRRIRDTLTELDAK
ncbi:MAG: serine/threonine protein kinase [Planctomycetes bacterium]|nr:serine/threonine protein kinase [Planctomycetota bacterium]